MDRYDVIVIGAGMAGINAAGRAHDEGARVAVIERDRVGGTCPIRGCIPTKALVRAAEIAHDARRADEFGIRVGAVEPDFGAVMRRVRAISDQGADGARRYLESLERLELVMGEAAFTEPGVVEVDGRRLSAPAIVIATGAEPIVPPLPGLADTPYLTSDDVVLRIGELPERLLVIGAGPIGLELGQALSRLGSTVTIVEVGPRVLEAFEPEVGEALAERLAAEGIELLVGVEITRVGTSASGAREIVLGAAAGQRVLTGDAILLGTGRAPALERLRPDKGGVRLGRRGLQIDHALSAGEGVLGVGDAVGPPYGAFTHVARRMGGVAGANAVDGGSREVDPDVGPRAIFTDPEVATIGLTEAGAREAGHRVGVGIERFSGGKARAWGEEHGVAKVVCEAGGDRILGASVVAYHAADLIHPVAVAMRATGASARPLIDTYHVHPTLGEVVQRAVKAAAA